MEAGWKRGMYESIRIGKKTLREVQDRKAKRQIIRNLRESETQTATGIK